VCDAWGTLAEEAEAVAPVVVDATDRPTPIGLVDPLAAGATSTGVAELDRVLGGGLVPGSVTLLGGEPGIGKSTLLTQVGAAVARGGGRALYVSAEESRHQVRLRAERLGAVAEGLWLLAETNLPAMLAAFDDVHPDLVLVDSIQTVEDPELGSAPGSVNQVRGCTHRLVREAKSRGLAILLVGHVTKDGALAGPRVLEHVVDTVVAFEGDRHHALRLVRTIKHRFGASGELGVFEMTDAGLVEVPDAGALFLADRRPGTPGSAVVPAMEGTRPVLVEIQGLVSGHDIAQPRRSAQGVDAGRLAVVLAVLEERAGVRLRDADVFAVASGGVRVGEPAADLAIAFAVVSSRFGIPLPADVVACGEIGLGGELRQVAHTKRRLAEAARLGFGRALVPWSAPDGPPGVDVIRAETLADAMDRVFLDAIDPVASASGGVNRR
jgi:DNA repair protein RadA/Sms